MSDPESGLISIADGVLTFRSDRYGNWSIRLTEIRTIEEYTNTAGPGIDDYFYCFHTASGEETSASFYAAGWSEVWPVLKQTFSDLLSAGLCNSTSGKSRILWSQDTE